MLIVLPAAQLREFLGSFFRELGPVRRVGTLQRQPLSAAQQQQRLPSANGFAAAASQLALPADQLDTKHSQHSRHPSKSWNGDVSAALQSVRNTSGGTGSAPGSKPTTPNVGAAPPLSVYHSTVTFALGVFASWRVTFEVQFWYERLSALRSITAAEVVPRVEADRPDLMLRMTLRPALLVVEQNRAKYHQPLPLS